MRKLLAKDLAPFTRVLAKMELKSTIRGMFGDKKESGDMVSELVWGVVENYHKAENEFYAFLGGLEDKTPKEISELDLADFINIITELFSEKNMPFFKLAAK
jgi:hypothetical protein